MRALEALGKGVPLPALHKTSVEVGARVRQPLAEGPGDEVGQDGVVGFNQTRAAWV